MGSPTEAVDVAEVTDSVFETDLGTHQRASYGPALHTHKDFGKDSWRGCSSSSFGRLMRPDKRRNDCAKTLFLQPSGRETWGYEQLGAVERAGSHEGQLRNFGRVHRTGQGSLKVSSKGYQGTVSCRRVTGKTINGRNWDSADDG